MMLLRLVYCMVCVIGILSIYLTSVAANNEDGATAETKAASAMEAIAEAERKEAEAKQEQAAKKKPGAHSTRWSDMDLNDLEKEWEEGDDEELLEHEFDRIRRVSAKKQPKIDMNNPQSIRDAYNKDPHAFGGGGGIMMFVEIKKNSDGSKKDFDFLAKKWSTLLKTGGLAGTVYNVGDNILVHIDRGWTTKDAMHFLALQPEVDMMTVNSKNYYPKDIISDDDDDDDDGEL